MVEHLLPKQDVVGSKLDDSELDTEFTCRSKHSFVFGLSEKDSPVILFIFQSPYSVFVPDRPSP